MVFSSSPANASRKPTPLGWRVVSLLSKRKTTLLCLGTLIALATCLDVAVPFLTKSIIDRVLHALDRPAAASIQTLTWAALSIFAATAGTRLLRSFYNFRLVQTAAAAEDDVKNRAFANFLSLDTAFHTSVNTGEIVGALDRGGTAVFVILNEILGQNLVPPLLIALGVLTSLACKNVWIALIVFTPLPAYLAVISRLGSRMQTLEQHVSKSFETVTKESYDIASNVRLVKKFGQEKSEAATQRKLLNAARVHHHRAERLWATTENIQSFIATAGRVAVVTVGGLFVLGHRCSVGDYVLFIAMQDMIYGPISQLSVILPKLRRNLSRAERLFEILDERAAICDAPHSTALLPLQSSIEFRDVSFRYPGSDRWALRSVNLSIPAGATVALIGVSGSGKSTLVSLLQRLYDPEEGSILIDGQDIRKVHQQSLRDQIAVVPQEIDLFSRTIAENLSYGQTSPNRSGLESAARIAQAHDFIRRCSDGYETAVGERGARLSGGERQRLGIARAISRNPGILIFDEATSHLDNESERLIQLALENVTHGRTCFVIAHRLSTVRNADLVVVFNEGGIEAIGAHEDLWLTSATYRKLHGIHLTERPLQNRAIEAPAEEETLFALPMAG